MSPKDKKQNEPNNDSLFTPLVEGFKEARQYLIALGSSIVAFGLFQGQLTKIVWTNWLADAVALVPVLLVFVCKTLPRLIKQRRNGVLVQRSKREIETPKPAATEPDYFCIGPYSESRQHRYDRADGVHKEVLSWLKKTTEPIAVLSGLSGTGKTSLLEAFVIPELCKATPSFKVLLIRGFDDPLMDLRRRLLTPGSIWTKPGKELENLELDQIIRRAVAYLHQADSAARLLVVLDQFEELLTLQESGSGAATTDLTSFLGHLRKNPVEDFLVLLAVRTDYEAFLEPLGVPPLDRSRNWCPVPAFTHSAAVRFLTAPETGLNIQPARLQRVMAEAAAADGTPGLIRPIILNMLGVVLQRIADSPEAERPTRTLLTDDLRASIDHPSRRSIARAILPFMLTEADTKQPTNIRQLTSATKLDPHVVHGCLLQIETSGYVRQVGRADDIMDRIWEVSHDFVARLLGPILKNPFLTFWERSQRIMYPVSIGAWVVAAILLNFARPWLDRKAAESQLETGYGFSIQDSGKGYYVLTEQNRSFIDLQAASPYLRKLGPIRLIFFDTKGLTNAVGLKDIQNLQSLSFSACSRLTSLDGLKGVLNLQDLRADFCGSLTNIDAVKDLKDLQSLSLTFCSNVTNIDALKELKNLQTLDLSSLIKLTSIDALKDLKSLKYLKLASLENLSSIDALRVLKNLHSLDLFGWMSLNSIDALKELENLETLSLSACHSLTSIDELKGLKNLKNLNLSYCTSLTNFDALKDLKNLQTLDLSFCGAFTRFDELYALKNLRTRRLLGFAPLPKQTIEELHKQLPQTTITTEESAPSDENG